MIIDFEQVRPEDLGRVGGKGLNLGALTRAGFPVPPGFCITTEAFTAFIAGCPEMTALYAALDALAPGDVAAARLVGARVREALSAVPLPASVSAPALAAWTRIGREYAYAVRSSATAEDLPGASFAGQQDTFLNVRGEEPLLSAIHRCLISLFTDRAILYRAQGRHGHRGVSLAVVVQRLVRPEASGILFTADPVSGHRGTLTIDAGFGLGEALVSGLVNADLFRVDKQSGRIIEARIGDKALAIRPLPEGGTVEEALPPQQRAARVLSDAQVEALTRIGIAVEAHYGGVPQDIEWCIEGDRIFLVQARPVTSLFPLPESAPSGKDHGALHVYVSFGHLQNMTDPISPLGQDLLRAILPFRVNAAFSEAAIDDSPLTSAGGRLYIDVTRVLALRPLRRLLGGALLVGYPDLGRALGLLADRAEVQAAEPPSFGALQWFARLVSPVPPLVLGRLLAGKPEDYLASTEALIEQRVQAMAARLRRKPAGAARIREGFQAASEIIPSIVPIVMPRMASGVVALGRLRSRFAGTPQAADVELLQRGLVGNITTEMDLQVGDLADRARPWPELCAALQRGAPRMELEATAGGAPFLAALDAFLERFGMRGSGEIDIARGRWNDDPSLLFQVVIGGFGRAAPGEHRAHFARLQAKAEAAGERLVAAAGGPLSRRWVERLVRVVRYGLGLREHPKFLLIRTMGLLCEEIRAEARRLEAEGLLAEAEDVWFLRYGELRSLLSLREGGKAEELRAVVATRREAHARYRHMMPPLAFTSEGEIPQLPPPADLPPGALAGLGASAGVVEGIARVVLDPANEVLRAGEILVAPYTDPGWTPLFVHAAGLVCDVGGMMTHGSVVAREYGIPAVVGVGKGTRTLKTGDRLRVDGSRGIVEVLREAPR
jgi:rifampicin phosphotransferase